MLAFLRTTPHYDPEWRARWSDALAHYLELRLGYPELTDGPGGIVSDATHPATAEAFRVLRQVFDSRYRRRLFFGRRRLWPFQGETELGCLTATDLYQRVGCRPVDINTTPWLALHNLAGGGRLRLNGQGFWHEENSPLVVNSWVTTDVVKTLLAYGLVHTDMYSATISAAGRAEWERLAEIQDLAMADDDEPREEPIAPTTDARAAPRYSMALKPVKPVKPVKPAAAPC